jgi:hypothetical protein
MQERMTNFGVYDWSGISLDFLFPFDSNISNRPNTYHENHATTNFNDPHSQGSGGIANPNYQINLSTAGYTPLSQTHVDPRDTVLSSSDVGVPAEPLLEPSLRLSPTELWNLLMQPDSSQSLRQLEDDSWLNALGEWVAQPLASQGEPQASSPPDTDYSERTSRSSTTTASFDSASARWPDIAPKNSSISNSAPEAKFPSCLPLGQKQRQTK